MNINIRIIFVLQHLKELSKLLIKTIKLMNEHCKYIKEYYSYILDRIKPNTESKRIVFDLIYDLTDRRGLRQEFEKIDAYIQDEIIDKWIGIIEKRDNIIVNVTD